MTNEPQFNFYAQELVEAPARKRVMTVFAHRKTKKQQIAEYFMKHLGIKFPTSEMHNKFGTAFRTRVSDINLDTNAAITIHNDSHWNGVAEVSVYWASQR